jgi:hypothetical protein
MLADRPQMLTYRTKAGTIRRLDDSDEMVRYAIARFSGSGLLNRVKWSTTKPTSGTGAEHDSPTESTPGVLYLQFPSDLETGTHPTANHTFEEYWDGMVFELFNMENARDFWSLWDDAALRRLDRQTYMLRCAALEHVALLKTVVFYRERWKPWADAHGFPTDERIWDTDTPASFVDWLATRDESYPEVPFGKSYDELDEWVRERTRAATTQTAPSATAPSH